MKNFKLARLSVCLLAMYLLSGSARGNLAFTNLVSFNSNNGANPFAGLVQGVDGNFYGTTSAGGSNGAGTIFQLTLSGVLTTRFSFGGTNGAVPFAALFQANDSNFYGTTYQGGSNNNGTVFRFATNGLFQSLCSFNGTNGASPRSGVVQGRDGLLYGTTALGGTNGVGAIYQVTTNSAFTNLVPFYTNGYNPYAGLIQGADGSFYGTTYHGGAYGYGTVFQLKPSGAISNLFSFTGTNDGAFPDAALAQDASGFLYGTTYYGGSNGLGAVFKISTNGVLSNLFSFAGSNGCYPQAGLVQAADGNLYGTTQSGGAYTNGSGYGYGTLFQLTTNGTLTTLFSFDGTNGAFPQSLLIQGTDGKLYGTAEGGGTNGFGTVFRFSITAPAPPIFQSMTRVGTNVFLAWTATIGQTYQMTCATNLVAGGWQNLGGTVNATNILMTTVDTTGLGPRRYYRVVLLP